ncbi:DUF1450 domain-containing protein [Bacillus tuaregi]|uniref:DUF1450 domain-containing protein n=1 Tax=Bacillus tuaregi TaxID=1816695 RepID=UPI0008F927D6|nr:DUF1450 domain-containing protein [Bacillus tuaregi]
MTNPKIEFCMLNLERKDGSKKARQMIEKELNIETTAYGCMTNCHQCAKSLYAVVNGEYIYAESSEQLVERIYKQLGVEAVL